MQSYYTKRVNFLRAKWRRRIDLRDKQGQRPEHQLVGSYGEDVAVSWLKSQKIKILYRNFSAPNGGEIDIVAREGDLLLFIEVKTRFEIKVGRPIEAVNQKKRAYMRKGAQAWLKLLGRTDIPYQFDVFEIVLTEGEVPLIHRVKNIEMGKISWQSKGVVQMLEKKS